MSVTAVVAGFFAGFFGIGGGIITVPCLFYIFEVVGIDKSFVMHLAVGTSFAIIVPTAIMSVFTHYKHQAVDAPAGALFFSEKTPSYIFGCIQVLCCGWTLPQGLFFLEKHLLISVSFYVNKRVFVVFVICLLFLFFFIFMFIFLVIFSFFFWHL